MGKKSQITGFVLHLLVGGLMIFAGSGKVFGFAPAEVVEKMSGFGFGDRLAIIGGGEMLSAILLIVPLTFSFGTLMTSGFWGGVICIHMSHHESIALGVVMLVLTWVGAFLRDRRTLASFLPKEERLPAGT